MIFLAKNFLPCLNLKKGHSKNRIQENQCCGLGNFTKLKLFYFLNAEENIGDIFEEL
jgi:hypothetical protein